MANTSLAEILASASSGCEERTSRMIEVIDSLARQPISTLDLDGPAGATNYIMLSVSRAFNEYELQVKDFSLLHLAVLLEQKGELFDFSSDEHKEYILNKNKTVMLLELAKECLLVKEFSKMSILRCIRAMSEHMTYACYERTIDLLHTIDRRVMALPFLFQEATTYRGLLNICQDILRRQKYGPDAQIACDVVRTCLVEPFIQYESSRRNVEPEHLSDSLINDYIELYKKGVEPCTTI